jgi:hypothetical protein
MANLKGPPERAFRGLAVTTATGWVTTATGVSTSRKPGVMFAASVMGRSTRVAMLIVRRVGTKTVEGLLPAFWHRSMVAVARIVALVDMAIKSMRSVKPGAGPDKYSSCEPIRTIVAIGRTVIRSIRKVAVGAHWSHPNIDRHLRRCT